MESFFSLIPIDTKLLTQQLQIRPRAVSLSDYNDTRDTRACLRTSAGSIKHARPVSTRQSIFTRVFFLLDYPLLV